MTDFRMPTLGADMEAGTLVEWKVKPGDRVKKGDLIASVETVKGVIEVEVFEDGVVEELLVDVGQTVPVNTPLARLREAGESAEPERAAAPAPRPPEDVTAYRAGALAEVTPARPLGAVAAERGGAATDVASARPLGAVAATDVASARPRGGAGADRTEHPGAAPPTRHVRASPVARKMAEALHVDLARLHGSGPGGAVLKADVEAASREGAPRPSAPPRPAQQVPVIRFDATQMRRAIGAAMSRSKREIPHYYLSTEIDLSRALAWMQVENANRSVAERLLPAALLLKAAALAVNEAPEVNGTFEEGRFTPSKAVHLGVAIALKGGGLVAPGLRDAQALSLGALMQQLTDLVTRARAGRLRASELGGQTLTVTNLGEVGVTAAFPVIVPPQVAMVGFGKVQQRPWVVSDGAIGARPIVVASLAADHRVSDGLRGARYLATLDQLLQHPEAL